MKQIVLAFAAFACVSQAAVEGPGKNQFLQPARTDARIEVDGKLDEPAWSTAPVFDAFVQRYPVAGNPPTQKTAMRVLYDNENLYVSVYCYDTEPALINRRLGRRDSNPFSDAVQVMIDSSHDHRAGYLFYLNAGGVQGDGIFFDDRNYSGDWDGIWEGASTLVSDGWIAEFSIPLTLLRFPQAEVQTWGFGARRDIARTNEEIDSVTNPRSSNASVSRFGHLTGMTGLKPRRGLELLPYVASRAVLRPQFSDGRADPRLLDPSIYAGLDFKTSLTSDLTLNGTVNPDFGQVEADQAIQNLSTFEVQFPEKRPFFTEGMELFQPVGGSDGQNQRVFYSRRIGLLSPILGAVKLTGSVAKGVEVGLLDAVVMSASQGEIDEANPDRRFRFHLEQPLRFGPNDELPAIAPAPTNYLSAIVRTSVGSNSHIGAMFSSAVPLGAPCTVNPAACLVDGGSAAALRWDLKSANSEYGFLGQIVGSQVVGGPQTVLLRDSTELHPNTLGWGALLRAGRFGGEGWKWDVGYDFSSPTLHLRPTGFLRSQNEHAPRASVRFTNQSGLGPLRSLFANFTVGTRLSSDGRWIGRGNWVNANVQMQLPSYEYIGVEGGADFGVNDIREVAATGIPLERPNTGFLVVFGETNPNLPLRASGHVAVGFHDWKPPVGWGANVTLAWRPTDALETSLQIADDMTPWGPRFVGLDDSTSNRFFFGDLESQFLSVTLRQQVMITPKLSLQAYAQMFNDFGVFGPYSAGTSDGERSPIRLEDLQPVSDVGFDPSFYGTLLNVNVVLRWEYRLGSTVYLVYTRGQSHFTSGPAAPRTLLPVNLFSGPSTDAFLVKWSYYWNV